MKPILFNTEMVKAILEGRKTVTRRVVKPNQFDGDVPLEVKTLIDGKELMCEPWKSMTDLEIIRESYKPPYQAGDVLYVMETFVRPATHIFWYRATPPKGCENLLWSPSIHMPKEAARIFLKVTGAPCLTKKSTRSYAHTLTLIY